MFQIGHVSLTSADTYRRDSYCLARVFQNLPAPPKQYGVFDVFCDFQSFFQLENLGSHLAMCPDDRFLPQGKQILPEIRQVRPMPKEKPDQLGSIQKNNVYMQIQSEGWFWSLKTMTVVVKNFTCKSFTKLTSSCLGGIYFLS